MKKQTVSHKAFAIVASILVVLAAILGWTAFSHPSASAQSNGRIKVVFWHEMTGPAQQQLIKFSNEFNQSQKKYEVVPEFEGSYNEAVQKIINTHGTDASPAVFQSMDISTSQMHHTGYTTPVQKFIDADNYDVNKITS